MRRRPSGSPTEERADDPFEAGISRVKSNESPSRSLEAPNKLRFESSKEDECREQRRQSGETSPRSKTSATWKRTPSIEPSAKEKDIHTTMLPTGGKRKPNTMDVRSLRRPQSRSPWSCSPLTILTTGLAAVFLLSVVHSFLNRQVDPQGCFMSTMTPTYIKMSGFDTEHSRFATKYLLYLYREEGVDHYTQDNIGLRGAPVLFLPGNAGSYKQVRSLSSEASRHFHNVVQHDHEAIRTGTSNLDFFMIDFNEDLAAFHGQTIIDQADYVNEAVAYILSLYHDPHRSRRDPNLPDPSSVILIGHSMGGIVARTVLITPNYQSNSVNTIITMSTPHARPPLSFDADMVNTYQRVNDYWRESYSQKGASNNPLWHTTLISFAGGGRDTMVPSDYTSLSSLVPESHGFTVFTSTIPDIWTSMDHLAITWCDQFRKVLIKTLFEMVDVRRATQTKHRTERMKVFRKWLLTGLEVSAPKTLPWKEPTVLLTLGDSSRSAILQSSNVTMRRFGTKGQNSAQLLSLPSGDAADEKLITLLTDQVMTESGDLEQLEILFCSIFPLPHGHSSDLLPVEIDLSDGSPGATRLACKKVGGDAVRLPASTRTSKHAFDQVAPFTYLQYQAADIEEHQFLAIIDKANELSGGWLIADIADTSRSFMNAEISLKKLLMTGLHLELPADRPMMTSIRVPVLHSSLLAYSLKLGSLGCGGDGELFTPLLRQYIDQPHESKFFVNVKQADINLHGIAPFMPPTLNGDEHTAGVSFQLWTDPTCDATLNLTLKVDVAGSLGKLVMRYRTLLAAFPLLVVAMVLRKQFRVYDETGVFITFTESLDKCLRTSLPILFLAMTLFATSVAQSATSVFRHNQVSNSTETIVDYTRNDLFLGSSDTFFWFLVPLMGLVSVGVCIAVNHLVLAITYPLSIVSSLCASKSGYIRHDETRKVISSTFAASTPRRRAINTVILLLLVAFVIPYQFAYVVGCIVQLATSTRALGHAREMRTATPLNFSNYTHSILILMLWVLPLNVPVLVVWIHNLAVHWLTPFSSHHNILSVVPFILLVEKLTSGAMIPRITTKVRHLTNVIFFSLAVFTAMYGVTYAYMLHQLVNLVALWLVIVHFACQGGSSFSGLKGILEGDDDSDAIADVKKMP
jgi:GPI inositol-deacylase